MRKNYNYTAVAPNTRNEFIDSVATQKEAIVISHELLKELTEEINSQLSSRGGSKFFKRLAVPMAILSWSNPIGWICSGIVFLCGIFTGVSDHLKKYVIHSGYDVFDNQILVFIHKHKVNMSYDKILLPENVKSVDYKKEKKWINNK